MDCRMSMIGQVVAAAVIGAVCAAVVKKQTPDLALVVTLCAVALILSTAMAALSPVRELIDVLGERAGLSAAVLAPVVKTLGIALLTRVCAELCRDANEGGIAAAVEIAGGVCALLVCMPLFQAVLALIMELI